MKITVLGATGNLGTSLVELLSSDPRIDEVTAVAQVVRGRFLYSGGIGALEDLERLAALRQVNLAGVIAGKALYEGRFTVAEGQAALDGG